MKILLGFIPPRLELARKKEEKQRLCLADPHQDLSHFTKTWIKSLHTRLKTVKPLEANRGKMLLDIGLGSNFLDRTPKAQATKANINKWDCMKLKGFCTAKEVTTK